MVFVNITEMFCMVYCSDVLAGLPHLSAVLVVDAELQLRVHRQAIYPNTAASNTRGNFLLGTEG